MLKNIVIVGAGGFGREVAWLIEDINKLDKKWNILGYIDDNEKIHGKVLNNVEVLGGLDWLEGKENIYYVCAVGNPKTKEQIVSKLSKYPIKAATLIHPSTMISDYVEIGEGCIICAACVITVNIKIGNHVIVNLDCTIGHDAIIGDFSTILPSVNISGNTFVEESCEIGTGSAIIQGIKIGKGSTVGAGAVVVRDLPECCTAVGVPAKVIKINQ